MPAVRGSRACIPRALASLTVLTLAGCVAAGAPPQVESTSPSADCSVSQSAGWEARLEPGTGPRAARILHVSGEVELPTPGYTVILVPGPADRAMPPSQRFQLKAIPPQGISAQVLKSTHVEYRDAATYPAYRSIVILCGERVLARIEKVSIQP